MNQIIGALWKREKDGKEYYSGVIRDLHGDINIAAFPNNRKTEENQPDFNIVVSWGYEKNGKKEEVSQPAKKNGKKKKVEVDDDIAF
ncbi:MAG: hypothetical protein V1779_17615 [bacterium]